jgi:hypothetical protein
VTRKISTNRMTLSRYAVSVGYRGKQLGKYLSILKGSGEWYRTLRTIGILDFVHRPVLYSFMSVFRVPDNGQPESPVILIERSYEQLKVLKTCNVLLHYKILYILLDSCHTFGTPCSLRKRGNAVHISNLYININHIRLLALQGNGLEMLAATTESSQRLASTSLPVTHTSDTWIFPSRALLIFLYYSCTSAIIKHPIAHDIEMEGTCNCSCP